MKYSKYTLLKYLSQFEEPVPQSTIAKYFQDSIVIIDLQKYATSGLVIKFHDESGFSYMPSSDGNQFVYETELNHKQYNKTFTVSIIALILSFIALIPNVICPIISFIIDNLSSTQ